MHLQNQISLKQRAIINDEMLGFLSFKPIQIQHKFIKDEQNNMVIMSVNCPHTGIIWIQEGVDEKYDD